MVFVSPQHKRQFDVTGVSFARGENKVYLSFDIPAVISPLAKMLSGSDTETKHHQLNPHLIVYLSVEPLINVPVYLSNALPVRTTEKRSP